MGKSFLSTLFGCVKPKAAGENGTRKKKKKEPKEPKPRSEIRKPTLQELIKIDKEVTERVELLSNQLTAAFISSSFGHGKEGSGHVKKKKRTREELDKLQALINASQAERRRLHSVKLQLEEMNNSNDAAIAVSVDSTSVCGSTSVAGQVGDALSVAVAIEPEVVQDDEFDDNLFSGTHVVQDILGSLIGEVEVGREFEISSAFGKEDSPLDLQVLENKLSKLADNDKKNAPTGEASCRSAEIPSIDIKTAISIEESSCISTENPSCSTSQVDADDVDKEEPEEQVDEAESQDEDLKMMKERVEIKWLNLHD